MGEIATKIEPTPGVIASRLSADKAARQDRRRLRLAAISEPEDHQERHSGTEAVMVKIDQTRMQQKCRRRKSDARLMEALSPDQERAADAIGAAFRIIAEGMGAGVARYGEQTDRGIGGTSESADEYRQRLVSRYFEWGRACFPAGISHAAVMDIIAYGHGARYVDRSRHKASGWSMTNLIDGLSLYCKIHRIG